MPVGPTAKMAVLQRRQLQPSSHNYHRIVIGWNNCFLVSSLSLAPAGRALRRGVCSLWNPQRRKPNGRHDAAKSQASLHTSDQLQLAERFL